MVYVEMVDQFRFIFGLISPQLIIVVSIFIFKLIYL